MQRRLHAAGNGFRRRMDDTLKGADF